MPYAELPTAYLYKQSGTPRPQSCGCNRAPTSNFEVVAGNPPPEETHNEPIIPVPADRPDPAADPETLANLDGGLTIDVVRRLAVPPPQVKVVTQVTGGEKRIRVVGPVFLPDPGEMTVGKKQ